MFVYYFGVMLGWFVFVELVIGYVLVVGLLIGIYLWDEVVLVGWVLLLLFV